MTFLQKAALWMTLGAGNAMAPLAALAQGGGDVPNPNPPNPNPPNIGDGGDRFTIIGMDPWVAVLIVLGVVLVVALVAMAMAGGRTHTDTHVHH